MVMDDAIAHLASYPGSFPEGQLPRQPSSAPNGGSADEHPAHYLHAPTARYMLQ
jgi:hypothetical protein